MLTFFKRAVAAKVFRLLCSVFVTACRRLAGIQLSPSKLWLASHHDNAAKYSCSIGGVHFRTEGLQLNPVEWNELLKYFGLSLKVAHGYVGDISVSVGFTSFSLHVSGVSVIMKTTPEHHYDPVREREKALLAKRRAVVKLKQLGGATGKENKQGGGLSLGGGRMWNLLQHIIGSIVVVLIRMVMVTVQDVHICLEDEITGLDKQTAVAGVRLREFTFTEMKEHCQKERKWLISTKTACISDFCVYCIPSVKQQKLASFLSFDKTHHFNLLEPLTVLATLTTSTGSLSVLQASVTAEARQIMFVLKKGQLKKMADVLGYLQHMRNTLVFMKHRPSTPVHGNAALWWRYALQCVSQLRTKWDWLEVKEQRDKQKEYQQLYRKSLEKKPPKGIQQSLMLLEDDMSLMNIMLSRKKVDSEFEREESRNLYQWTRDSARRRRSSGGSSVSSVGCRFSSVSRGDLAQVSKKLAKPFLAWCGEVCVSEAELSLAECHHCGPHDDGETMEPEQVITFIMDQGKLRMEQSYCENHLIVSVGVGYLQCKGVESQGMRQRPKLLLWSETTCTGSSNTDEDMFTASITIPNQCAKSCFYDYFMDLYLHPSTVILHWPTVLKIGEYIALLNKSDPALKDAVREKVREIESEGRTWMKQFIRNNEVVKMTANVSLPTLVLPASERSLSLMLGQLKARTKPQHKSQSDDGDVHIRQVYSLLLTRTTIKYCSNSCLEDHEKSSLIPPDCGGHTLYSADSVAMSVEYSTYPDNENKSSRLHSEATLPYIGICVSQSQLQSLAKFSLTQLKMAHQLYNILTSPSSSLQAEYPDSKKASLKYKRTLRHMTSQLRVSNEPAPFKALDDIIHVSMMSSSPSRDPDSPSSTAPKSMTPTRRKSIMSFSGDDKEDAEDWDVTLASIKFVVAKMEIKLKKKYQTITACEEKLRDVKEENEEFKGLIELERVQELGFLNDEESKADGNEKVEEDTVEEGQPYITLMLKELGACYSLKEQSSSTHLQLYSFDLTDHTHSGVAAECVLVETEKEFLIIDWDSANPRSSMFSSAFNSVETSCYIDVEPFTVCLHLESVTGILDFVTQLKLPRFGDVLVSRSEGSVRRNKSIGQKSLLSHQCRGHVRTMCDINVKMVTLNVFTQQTIVSTGIAKELFLGIKDTWDRKILAGHLKFLSLSDELSQGTENMILYTTSTKRLALLKLIWKDSSSHDKSHFSSSMFSGYINVGSIRLLYLHKYMRTVLFVWTLVFTKFKQCRRNLMVSMTTTKFNPVYYDVPSLSTSDTIRLYRIVINLRDPSFLLPKSSTFHEPPSTDNSLTASVTHLSLTLTNSLDLFGVKQPHIDTTTPLPSYLHATDTSSFLYSHSDTVSQSHVNVSELELHGFQISRAGHKLLSPIQLTVSRGNPFTCLDSIQNSNVWNAKLEKPELVLSSADMKSLVRIVQTNLTEDEPLQHMLDVHLIDCFQTKNKNENVSESPTATAVVCCSCDELRLSLVLAEERENPVCVLKFIDMSMMVHRGGGGGKVVLTLNVRGLTGTAGHMTSDTLPCQRIVYQHSKLDKLETDERRSASRRHVLQLVISWGPKINLELYHTCLCLWPQFLTSLFSLLREFSGENEESVEERFPPVFEEEEKQEGKVLKNLEQEEQVKVVVTLEGENEQYGAVDHSIPDTCHIATDDNEGEGTECGVKKSNSSNGSGGVGGCTLEVTANWCVVALLENPENGEVTSPGMCLEFKSHTSRSSHGLVLRYSTSPTQWIVAADQCDCQARLCIWGEELIPLNPISSHCTLEFRWLVSSYDEKVDMKVSQVELHLSMEVVELLGNFYQTLQRQSSSSINLVLDETGSDIWVVKEMKKQLVRDNVDTPVDHEANQLKNDAILKKQEANFHLPEVVINLDIMCAGDSSSVICLHSVAELKVTSWSQMLQGELSLSAEAYVYNVDVASWEPLIEPVEDYATAEYRPWAFKAEIMRLKDGLDLSIPDASSSSHYDSSSNGSKPLSSPISKSSESRYGVPVSSESSYLLERSSRKTTSFIGNPSSSSLTSLQLQMGMEERISLSRVSMNGRINSCDGEGRPYFVVACTSNDRLELTVTPSAIATIKHYVNAVNINHRVAMENIRNSLYGTKPPVQMQNKLAASVQVFPGPTFKDGSSRGSKYTKSVSLPHKVLHRFPSKTTTWRTDSVSSDDLPKSAHSHSMSTHLSSVTEREEEGVDDVENVDGVESTATDVVGNIQKNMSIHSLKSTPSPTSIVTKVPFFFANKDASFEFSDNCSSKLTDSEPETEEDEDKAKLSFPTSKEVLDIQVVEESFDQTESEGDDGDDDDDDKDGTSEVDGCSSEIDSFELEELKGGKKPSLQRRQSRCLVAPLESGFKRLGSSRRSARRKKKECWQPLSLTKRHKLQLQVANSPKSCSIPVSYPGLFSVPINHPHYGNMRIVCDVQFKKGVRKVIFHSGVQVENNLPVSVTLYSCDSPISNMYEMRTDEILQGDTHDLSLHCVATEQILRVGVGSGGYPSNEHLDWRVMVAESSNKKGYSVLLTCPESTEDSSKFYMQATIISLPTASPNHGVRPYPSYVIRLDAPLVIRNQLPFTLTFILKHLHSDAIETCELQPGEEDKQFNYYPLAETTISLKFKHNGLSWEGDVNVMLGSEVNTYCKVYGYDPTQQGKRCSKMYIKMQSTPTKPSVIHFFSSIWVVNKSGINIEIEHRRIGLTRKHDCIPTRCRGTVSSPVILAVKPGKWNPEFRVRVPGGDWSDKFIVTTAKKVTDVTSQRGEFSYMFSIVTHLLDNALTYILHVLAKYTISNQTTVAVTCCGIDQNGINDTDTAVNVPPLKVLPFWPGRCRKVGIDLADSDISLKPISFDIISPSVQPTKHPDLPVVTLQVQPLVSHSSVLISLLPHADHSALLLVQNHCCGISIKFMQRLVSGSGQLYFLRPQQQLLYSWDNPASCRELQWQVVGSDKSIWYTLQHEKAKKSSKVVVNVLREVEAEKEEAEMVEEEEVEVCWGTVFDGSQWVLRFWEKEEEYDKTRAISQDSQSAYLHLFCSFEGVGVSLVNSVPEEVIYCAITSSPVVWKKSRYKGVWSLFSPEESAQLEAALKTEQKSLTIADEKYDLESMQIHSERGGWISRCFNPGIWLNCSAGDDWKKACLKLGLVQVDNQLRNCELPSRVVFAGKERDERQDPQDAGSPFLDFYISIRDGNKSMQEYEKTLLRVKPMQLNMELGLVVALLPLVDSFSTKQSTEQFQQDMIQANRSLSEFLHVDNFDARRQEKVHYIDLLHITQTSLAVSYTFNGDYDVGSRWGRVVDSLVHFAPKGSCNIKLNSVTLTNKTTDLAHLKRLLWGHYKNELLWQFQKFALGLDVIGNPAQLMNTFQTGAKDLVSLSHQGISEGDAVSGIVHGMKSFFGHVVEGSAGSAARTTGSLSNFLLAISDPEYRKKHRHLRQTAAAGLIPNIKLGSTFFIKGVFHGATDIIVKPVSRASKEGVTGFFSGLGRGAVSILTKPTLAVVDLTQYTMEGIRSAVDDSYDMVVRQPRFIHADKILLPYNSHEAEGMYIQWHLSEVLEGERYIAHEWLSPSKPDKFIEDTVLLVTSQQLIQLRKQRAKYQKEWSVPLDCIEKTEAKQYNKIDEGSDHVGLLLTYKMEGKFLKKTRQKDVIVKMEDSLGAQIMAQKIKTAKKSLAKGKQQSRY